MARRFSVFLYGGAQLHWSDMLRSAFNTGLRFIKPELPTLVPEPPTGEGWTPLLWRICAKSSPRRVADNPYQLVGMQCRAAGDADPAGVASFRPTCSPRSPCGVLVVGGRQGSSWRFFFSVSWRGQWWSRTILSPP
jgi:hypothetical protein